MQREARSGRRVEGARAARVRAINRIGGLRLWDAHLRVSRPSGQPVVEIRQRPWIGLPVPVLFGVLAAAAARGAAPVAASFFVLLTGLGAWRCVGRRAWVRAAPDGLTVRRAAARVPKTIAWPDLELVRITTVSRPREFVTTLSVVARENDRPWSMTWLHPWSVRRGHLLSLVLLATCHRYGVAGLYEGETLGTGWSGGWWRRRPMPRDER